jgi:RimJ/RimL family protein N-acetyltransferase
MVLDTPYWRTKVQEKLDTVLKTERLVLKPLELEDVDKLWHEMSDPEISRYMAWEAHTDRSQTLDFVKAEITRYSSGKGVTWGVFRDDEFCGIASLIALMRTHRALTYNKAELAYWLAKRYQKQGIMIEALRQVLKFGFQDLGLHKICVSHFTPNTDSENLIKRLKFRYIGEQIEEYRKKGVWYNQKNYEILEKEFSETTISFAKEDKP